MAENNMPAGLASVLRCAVGWCSAFWIFSFVENGEPGGIALLPFAAMAVLTFLAFRLLLLKPRPLRLIIALAALTAAAESAAVLLLWLDLHSPAAVCFAVIAVICCVVSAVVRCIEPITAAKNITGLELTLMLLVFMFFMQTVAGIPWQYAVPLVFSSAISILSVIYQRLSGASEQAAGSRLRGGASAAMAFAATAAIIALFVLYAAGPLAKGTAAAFDAALKLASFLLTMIFRFVVWLASLMPLPEYEEYQYQEEIKLKLPGEGEMEGANPVVLVIICAAAAAGLLWLLWRLLLSIKGVKVGGKAKKGGTVSRSKTAFFDWLCAIAAAIKGKLLLQIRIRAARGSPRELYMTVIRSGRGIGLKKQPGETPCAFLLRTAALTSEVDSRLPAALAELSGALSLSLYSREEERPFPKESAALIRKSLGRALRRARFKRAAQALKGMAGEIFSKRQGS